MKKRQFDSALPDYSTVILAFGPTVSDEGLKISSRAIYGGLEKRKLWFVPRSHGAIKRAARLLFYENGVGVRGGAMIEAIEAISREDLPLLKELGIPYFRLKLSLR